MSNNNRRLNKHCIDCGKEITDRATRCGSCAWTVKRGYSIIKSDTRHHTLGKRCPDCDKEINDRAKWCSSCAQKDEKNSHHKYNLLKSDKFRNRRGRDYIIGYAEWIKDVFERDNYECQHCGSNKKLRAHHINSFSKYFKLQLIVENGITLCEYHHQQLHQLFGNDVTPKQLKWFFDNVK